MANDGGSAQRMLRLGLGAPSLAAPAIHEQPVPQPLGYSNMKPPTFLGPPQHPGSPPNFLGPPVHPPGPQFLGPPIQQPGVAYPQQGFQFDPRQLMAMLASLLGR